MLTAVNVKQNKKQSRIKIRCINWDFSMPTTEKMMTAVYYKTDNFRLKKNNSDLMLPEAFC